MMTPFEELLEKLSKTLSLPLAPDQNRACAIQIKKNITVQLQMDSTEEKLLIGCKIIELPPGKFRENVLKETLKANGLPDPRIGTFAYIEQINHLFLFQYYPIEILSGERLSSLLGPFIQMAESWKEAISTGKAGPQPYL